MGIQYTIESYNVQNLMFAHDQFQNILEQLEIDADYISAECMIEEQLIGFIITIVRGQKAVPNKFRTEIWNISSKKYESEKFEKFYPIIDALCNIYNQEHNFS